MWVRQNRRTHIRIYPRRVVVARRGLRPHNFTGNHRRAEARARQLLRRRAILKSMGKKLGGMFPNPGNRGESGPRDT
jgi:hypothetical protein